MRGEEAELARGAVLDVVAVLAAVEQHVGAADADAHAVGERLDRVRFGRAVAADRDDVERHAHRVAGAVGVRGRKVAQDAALDGRTVGLHDDRFGHRKRAVARDRDVGGEIDDALLACGSQAREREQQAKQPAHYSRTSTAPRSSVSKKAAGLKANSRPTIRSGKVCSRVTYCLTAPL